MNRSVAEFFGTNELGGILRAPHAVAWRKGNQTKFNQLISVYCKAQQARVYQP